MRRHILLLALVACTDESERRILDMLAAHDTAGATRPMLQRLAQAQDEDPGDGLQTTLVASRVARSIHGEARDGYAYSAQLLRMPAGALLSATLDNQLDAPTTIHWHGAGAPYEMDGVPWQRTPTQPGERFTYRFDVMQPGTFWFHPHFDTERQVDLGLYGALIVEDPSAPPVEDDVVLIFDSWGEADDDPHDHGLDGQDLHWTVNGDHDPVAVLSQGWLRLRLINASNTGYLDLDTRDMWIIATDQGIHTAPWQAESTVLAPGDRVELLVEHGAARDLMARPYTLHGGAAWGEPYRLMTLEAGAEPAVPVPPPTWDVADESPSVDPGRTDIVYTFQGDSQSNQWRINHEAFPDVTIAEATQGQELVLEIRNLSPTNHPFHGHGHAFEVLTVNGEVPVRKTVEDTVDVPIYGRVRLRYRADRTGDWMQHCHILPHADGGMMTILRVNPLP